ncbi:MAG: hypothetical protein KGJ13_07015 [Patescibacteria group bacterium]|nr:hypothetical protein [Patescibacteria group bacterium]
MTADTIAAYQPGGSYYAQLSAQRGKNVADAAAAAALTGDETAINAAITQAEFGAPLDTSTASILLNQLETNPLAAPLNSLGNLTGNTIGSIESYLGRTLISVATNPLVLAVLAGGVVVWIAGPDGVKNIGKKILDKIK